MYGKLSIIGSDVYNESTTQNLGKNELLIPPAAVSVPRWIIMQK